MILGAIFDMGGTLLDYGGARGWRHAWRSACVAVHTALRVAGHSLDFDLVCDTLRAVEDRLWFDAIAGTGSTTLDVELAEVLASLGIEPTATLIGNARDAYGRGLQSTCEVYDDSVSTLVALRAAGLRIGLISNTIVPGSVHVHDLERFGLLPLFDDLLFSADAGLWKPDPAVFQLSLRNLGLRADEAVFVGDRMIDDVWGAQRAGLMGVLKVRDLPDQDYAEGGRRGIRPDATIHRLAELPALLPRLEGQRSGPGQGVP